MTAPTLGDLGLDPSTPCRVKLVNEKSRWKEGSVRGRNRDGSIEVLVAGRVRSVPVERLELKARGPRGGVIWVAPTPPEVPAAEPGVPPAVEATVRNFRQPAGTPLVTFHLPIDMGLFLDLMRAVLEHYPELGALSLPDVLGGPGEGPITIYLPESS